MISADEIVARTTASDRSRVLDFVARADVAAQLESLGIDASTAKERVAALTDAEARHLAAKIDSLPAGADAYERLGWFVALHVLALVAVIIWLLVRRSRARSV